MMKRLQSTARGLLHEGLAPRQIALAMALGLALGIFPIYGPVTLLGIALAWMLGLNRALVVVAITSMALLKPLLIVPFLKLGERVFGADPMPISLQELSRQFADAPWSTLREFSMSFLHAMVGWLVVMPVLMAAIYAISLAAVRRWRDDGDPAAA